MRTRVLPEIDQKIAVSVVFVAAMFISIMDITIVNVALPTIGREFSLTATGVGSAVMFGLGYAMSHVFVSAQAAAFARITPADTGRASTLFNALRQLGGAVGVAVLTTSLTLSGVGGVASGVTADLHPYHVTFVVAAVLAVLAAGVALTVVDDDAESTRVRRQPGSGRAAEPQPALAD